MNDPGADLGPDVVTYVDDAGRSVRHLMTGSGSATAPYRVFSAGECAAGCLVCGGPAPGTAARDSSGGANGSTGA